jgi:hypothetical protein
MSYVGNSLFTLRTWSCKALRHCLYKNAITLEKVKNQLNINYDGSYNHLQVTLYPYVKSHNCILNVGDFFSNRLDENIITCFVSAKQTINSLTYYQADSFVVNTKRVHGNTKKRLKQTEFSDQQSEPIHVALFHLSRTVQ